MTIVKSLAKVFNETLLAFNPHYDKNKLLNSFVVGKHVFNFQIVPKDFSRHIQPGGLPGKCVFPQGLEVQNKIANDLGFSVADVSKFNIIGNELPNIYCLHGQDSVMMLAIVEREDVCSVDFTKPMEAATAQIIELLPPGDHFVTATPGFVDGDLNLFNFYCEAILADGSFHQFEVTTNPKSAKESRTIGEVIITADSKFANRLDLMNLAAGYEVVACNNYPGADVSILTRVLTKKHGDLYVSVMDIDCMRLRATHPNDPKYSLTK